jgi:D-arabinose 1-dehydrogenase-like Zn-dependent alcohol dehydrogenase
MTRTGRAAVYDAPNAPFQVREYPLRDVRPGEALVRVTMATICRSDIHSYQGHRPNPCPGILGHEIIGIIDQLGSEVRTDLRGDALAVGDRVTWTEFFADGPSYYRDVHDMPQKAPGVRKYGHDHVDEDPHFLGGFAEYCYILPGTGILKLPDGLPDAEAAPLNCGVATMIAVTEAAEIGPGDSVVVQGLGLLGLYGCAIAKARGAARVIALDTVEERLAMGRRFGADETFDIASLSEADLTAAVRSVARRAGRAGNAADRRSLRHCRVGQSGCPDDARRQPDPAPLADHPGRAQLSPQAPGAGARLRHRQPRALSVLGPGGRAFHAR